MSTTLDSRFRGNDRAEQGLIATGITCTDEPCKIEVRHTFENKTLRVVAAVKLY